MADPLLLTRKMMEGAVKDPALIARVAEGFVAYSAGRATIPPPGELLFTDPPGDVHVKFGAISGQPYYVVKVASSFYDNPKRGLSSSQGCMLAFRAETGELAACLLDEGLLTDVRTAIAGALCARSLAPRRPRAIGIVGTGIQARLQLAYLANVTSCRDAVVWGRNADRADEYAREMAKEGFSVTVASTVRELARRCDLVVTTTPSTSALLGVDDVAPGSHVTAVGADTPTKRELDGPLFARADLVVADSRSQCRERGDLAHALREGCLDEGKIVELGEILSGARAGRTSDGQLTVADLTGVAVQDIQIASFVIERFLIERRGARG